MEAVSGSDRGEESAAARGGAIGVVVLGAGRSGTSAITRAFLKAGFFAGEEGELLGANPSNPVGHYEPLSVLRTNERLLERLGSVAPPRDAQRAVRGEVEPELRTLLDDLIEKAGGAPVAVKEPRINRLLTLWGPVLDGTLHPVLAVRDPLEVARSMKHRYDTPIGHALALWETQMAHSLEWLNGRTVTIVPFVRLIGDPQLAAQIVHDAVPHLSPDYAKALRPDEASSALQPQLRTQNADDGMHTEYLTQQQAELWRYLEELPADNSTLSVPDRLREPSAGASAAVLAEDERMKLLGKHNALSSAYTESLARQTELEERFSAAHAAGLHAAQREERSLRELERVKASGSWRLTAPLRRLARLRRRR